MNSPPKVVAELAMRCLEIATGDPTSVVDRVCADNPELAAEVRKLLQPLAQVGLAREPTPQPGGPGHPEFLGPYRILRPLGGGGMGQVYLAEQSNLGNRKVALKVLRPELTWSQRSRDRFQREIETLSSLNHPGICPVYDASEIDGTPFLAMRYLVGETLAERIGRARDPGASGHSPGSEVVLETLEILEKVARALHAAHEHGLVHRDIKPANIMLVAGEGPILLDFGLARPDDDTSGLTLSGDPVGTPAYMAPEQVRGQAADRRSDVYGLGATLYEALTLHTPHEAPTRESLYRQILEGRVSRAGGHNRSVPHDVEVVLETALDPDPDRRYQTAEAFAEDLRRIREHKPIRARRPSLVLRTRRWVQRNPAVSAFLLLLAVGLTVTLLQLQQSIRLQGQLRESLDRYDAIFLAQEAVDLLKKDQALALDRAIKAVEKLKIPETVSVLHQAYAHAHERLRIRFLSEVWRARFMPGGRTIVVAFASEAPGMLVELDLDGKLVRTFAATALPAGFQHSRGAAHLGDVNAIELSPRGKRMLTVDRCGRAKIWDLATGREAQEHSFDAIPKGKRERAVQPWPLVDAAFLDENHVVTAEGAGAGYVEYRKQVRVAGWQLGETQPLWELEYHNVGIEAIAVCRATGRLAIASTCGVEIYDLGNDLHAKPRRVCAIRPSAHIMAVTFDPAGERLATADMEGRVELWAADGSHRRRVDRISGIVRDLSFDLRGQRLLIAGSQQALKMVHLAGEVVTHFLGHEGNVYQATFDPTGNQVLTAGGFTCNLYDTRVPQVPHLVGHTGRLVFATFGDSGRRVLTGSQDGTARVYDGAGSEVLNLHHDDEVTWCKLEPDGMILTGSVSSPDARATIHRWLPGGDELRPLDASPGLGTVFDVARRADGLRLVATAGHPYLRGIHGPPAVLQNDDFPASSVFFTPDGDEVIWSLFRGPVWCAPVSNPVQQRCLVDPQTKTIASAISPDGRILCTGHKDGVVRLWDATAKETQRKPLKELIGHEGDISWVAFSPQGDLLASCSQDGTAILWTADGERLAQLEGHGNNRVNRVAFSPDGTRLVTASYDRTARVWITDTEELLRLAKRRTRHEVNFSAE